MKKVIQQKKGFRNKPMPTKLEREAHMKAKAFVDEYQALRRKHGLQWSARITPIATGEMAQIEFYIRPYTEQAVTKPWSEALAENLATYKGCEHKETDGKTLTCLTCSLKHDDYGEGGKGISKEAEEKLLARIEKAKAEEKEKAEKKDEGKEAPAEVKPEVAKEDRKGIE